MRLGETIQAQREEELFKFADIENGTPRFAPIHPRIRSSAKAPLLDKVSVGK